VRRVLVELEQVDPLAAIGSGVDAGRRLAGPVEAGAHLDALRPHHLEGVGAVDEPAVDELAHPGQVAEHARVAVRRRVELPERRALAAAAGRPGARAVALEHDGDALARERSACSVYFRNWRPGDGVWREAPAMRARRTSVKAVAYCSSDQPDWNSTSTYPQPPSRRSTQRNRRRPWPRSTGVPPEKTPTRSRRTAGGSVDSQVTRGCGSVPSRATRETIAAWCSAW
jgi:hypothetical protein